MRKLILPLLFVTAGLASCKKESEELPDTDQNFYPTEIGKYIVYNYDSTIWDAHELTTYHLQGQVRYTTADTFRDAEGRLSYRITVESRENDTDPYKPNDVIYVTPSSDKVEMEQRNVKYIKMVFPVSEGKNWNGNAMIATTDPDYAEFNNEKWNYTYANYDQDYVPAAKLYAHTVTVNQIDDQLNDPDTDPAAYAYKNYAQEVYAYGVGMVYRERVYWEFQPKIDGGGTGYRAGYGVILRAVDNN